MVATFNYVMFTILTLFFNSLIALMHFNIPCFSVTLDYKSLLLLTVKKDDENFQLGGKGLDVEFCFFCTAIRVSEKQFSPM